MKRRYPVYLFGLILTTVCLIAHTAVAEDHSGLIPEEKLAELETKLSKIGQIASPVRRKLKLRRLFNEAESLLNQNASSPNRFSVLATLFRCQNQLVNLDPTKGNRTALMEVAGQLASAPNEYAAVRFDADLLVNQTDAAQQSADPIARTDALRPLVERYYETEVESKALKTALFLADEVGNNRLIEDLCRVIAERMPNSHELIKFQRDKFSGHVFAAAFTGTLEQADGSVIRFPMDYLGATTGVYFWSKENGGLDDLKELASAWNRAVADPEIDATDRYRFVSINVDNLPDAGESILREHGLDWPALRMPDGRSNMLFKAYGRFTPRIVTVSPTGYVALSLSGGRRHRTHDIDLKAMLDRIWVAPRYNSQLQSVFAGEFLVVDPSGTFDPARPPEWKAVTPNNLEAVDQLARTGESVPAEKLKAIQACFIAPPLRYRLTFEQASTNYQKADALCQEAIAAYPKAPDLWVVRNRRIMALLGLWKLRGEYKYFAAAATESRTALESGYPAGTDVIARFCLARETLRNKEVDPKTVISDFVKSDSPKAAGPVLAAAALLALDVGDRQLHEAYRRDFLDEYAEAPALWTVTAFFLDRYHRYWLYQPPFTGPLGLNYGREHKYFLALGVPEDAQRSLKLELTTLDGEKFRIPEDAKGKWTVIEFQTGDISTPYLHSYASIARKRLVKDLRLITAFLDCDAQSARVSHNEWMATLKRRNQSPEPFQTMLVPGGLDHPVVQQLGFVDEDIRTNMVILRPDGSIASAISGLSMRRFGSGVKNVIEWHDEKAVDDALARGDLEEAKRLAFTFAPIEPAVQQSKPRRISIPHLRSRAKVYLAMGELEAAATDAEQVYMEVKTMAETINVRTDEMNEIEMLKAVISSEIEKSRSGR